MADTQCLKTRVRNNTGKSTYFSFLPPHGKRMAAGEVYEFDGDLDFFMASVTLGDRRRAALARALEDGALRLLQKPSPIIWDNTHEEAKMITSTGGTLASVDACWGHPSSAGA